MLGCAHHKTDRAPEFFRRALTRENSLRVLSRGPGPRKMVEEYSTPTSTSSPSHMDASLDVLAQEEVDEMSTHLASLADKLRARARGVHCGSCMIQWETTLIAAAGGNSHLESDLGSPRSARSEFIDSTGSAQWDERW